MLMTFQILGIQPLPLPLDPSKGFLPSIDTARQLLDSPEGEGVKAIVLVTPNNPTGTTYSPDLIAQFADLAREKGVVLLMDETYRDFVRPTDEEDAGKPGRPHALFERPDWRGHVVSVGSFSKSYKIPGHRLGYIVAGKEVLNGVTTVADCIQVRTTSHPLKP
jgi:aspartate/methionine/tyrosine aminotransferase